jgi:hypothetical protein
MDVQEVGSGGMGLVGLDQGRDWCEYGNNHSHSIKSWEFIDQLRTC